jgi:hypothetical protein
MLNSQESTMNIDADTFAWSDPGQDVSGFAEDSPHSLHLYSFLYIVGLVDAKSIYPDLHVFVGK